MKAEYVQKGSNIPYLNAKEETIIAGTVVFIGAIAAIAAADIPPNEIGAAATEGVWDVPKAAEEIEAGKSVYYDEGSENVTATAEGHKFIGTAVLKAESSAANVRVKLNAGKDETQASEAV